MYVAHGVMYASSDPIRRQTLGTMIMACHACMAHQALGRISQRVYELIIQIL